MHIPGCYSPDDGGNIDRTTILPHTIIDQLLIWESEMDRLHAATSFCTLILPLKEILRMQSVSRNGCFMPILKHAGYDKTRG